jgi:hypothetical protein
VRTTERKPVKEGDMQNLSGINSWLAKKLTTTSQGSNK